ncbi:hypothetical protein HanRHA438_Chr13g0596591 [Helianthus annuus]|nr:hypothetical protein HanRHA438_Chr13g0596591 [Helianthus annuus]
MLSSSEPPNPMVGFPYPKHSLNPNLQNMLHKIIVKMGFNTPICHKLINQIPGSFVCAYPNQPNQVFMGNRLSISTSAKNSRPPS